VGRLSARVITRRLRNYYDGDHDAASARHKDFSLPAARGGSQPANPTKGLSLPVGAAR